LNSVFIIARKEFKELLTNRSAVILGAAISCVFAVSYGFTLGSGEATFPLDTTVFFIAAMLGVFMSYTFDAQIFLREKVDKVIETLLCSPVTLRQVWFGKTLGATFISYLISLLAMAVLITVLSFRLGTPTLPSAPVIVYLLFIVPVFIAAFAGLYGLAQMVLGLRENRFIGLIIFIPLFIGLSAIPSLVGSGLAISWLPVGIVLAASVALLLLAAFLSRFISKERIITTLS
jgi:ABC-2 type transport system permease protein